MGSIDFIATGSDTPIPATGYPRALRIDGHVVGNSSIQFYITARPTNALTTSGATDPTDPGWNLLVNNTLSFGTTRYGELCNEIRTLQQTGIPCPITIYYDMIPGTNLAEAYDIALNGGVAVRSLERHVEAIETTSKEIVHVLKHELPNTLVGELRGIKELIGLVLLRLPEARRQDEPSERPPSHEGAPDGYNR
jgi:hypothetical protein